MLGHVKLLLCMKNIYPCGILSKRSVSKDLKKSPQSHKDHRVTQRKLKNSFSWCLGALVVKNRPPVIARPPKANETIKHFFFLDRNAA